MGWNIKKEKTVEVRKNYPKAENWDRTAKIYCSKDKNSFAKIPKEYQPLMQHFLGKVIGEFVCDKIIDIDYGIEEGVYFDGEYREGFETNGNGNNPTCLSFTELENYLTENVGYGWHISDLVIYDTPKELSEFNFPHYRDCDIDCKKCKFGFPVEVTGGIEYDCDRKVKKPPQSWYYVERLSDG